MANEDKENPGTIYTNGYFAREANTDFATIEDIVMHRMRGEQNAGLIVVSVSNYDTAALVAKELKAIGVDANDTEGGLNLSLEHVNQLEPTRELLARYGLYMQVGPTNAESGRTLIAGMHKLERERTDVA